MKENFARTVFTALLALGSTIAQAHLTPYSRFFFVENKGQWPSGVQYKLELKGHRIWLESNALTFQIFNSDAHPLGVVHAQQEDKKILKPDVLAHNYQVIFEGSKPGPLLGSDLQSTYFNFLLGNDPQKWASEARAFEAVTYPHLYPKVDLKLYEENQRLKYDFYLKQGADVSSIRMKYSGTHGVSLQKGKLIISTALGTIEEQIPKAYQLVNGKAQLVECRFTLKGNVVGFEFPKTLDPRWPTVIDPVVNFFTYSGSLVDNWGSTAVSDQHRNAYTAGTVYGAFFPTTPGVVDASFNGNSSDPYTTYDVGVLKFDSTGKKLLWCTYLGGANAESPYSLDIDPDGNLLVLGSTSSTNFPTTVGALQRVHKLGPREYPYGTSTEFFMPQYAKGSDLFISRIQANGKKLMASTFLGGSGTDGLQTVFDPLTANYGDQFRSDLQVGPDGSVFVATHTKSADFPLEQATQTTLNGSRDGVVCKLNYSLTSLLWSTYFGGSGEDAFYGLALIGDQQVAVTGGSTSVNYPTSPGAYKSTGSGPDIDAIVSVFSQTTGQLVASTYSGTAKYDQAYLVQTDNTGNLLLFGQTAGAMPVSQGVFSQTGGGQFIQSFSPTLSTLLWSTCFGSTPGQPNLVPSAFLVDSCSHIYLSGWGGIVNQRGTQEGGRNYIGGFTTGLPVTSNALKSTTDGSDFYFMILSRKAESLIFGSFYGQNGGRGEHVDGGTSRFDTEGVVTQAICGCLDEHNNFFQGTSGSYQPNVNSNNCNNGVMQFNLLDVEARIKSNISATLKCPLTLSFNNLSVNGTSYTWYFGNGDSLTSTAPVVYYQYQNPGTYTIRLKAVNPSTCRYQSFDDTTLVIPDPFPFGPDTLQELYCAGDTLKPIFEELKNYKLAWSPRRWVSDPASYKPLVYPLASTLYRIGITDSSGCKTNQFYNVRNRNLSLDFEWSASLLPCSETYQVFFKSLKDSTEHMKWYFGDGATGFGTSVSHTYAKAGQYEVRLSCNEENCEENAFETVVLVSQPKLLAPEFEIEKRYLGCSSAELYFINQSLNAEGYYWDFGDGYQSTEVNPTHTFEKPGTYTVKLKAIQDKCYREVSQEVVVEDFLVPTLITSNEDGRNDAFKISGLEPGSGLELYDRWGKKIFETDNYQNDWRPTKIQPGTYFFNIRFQNEAHCNGWVQVSK